MPDRTFTVNLDHSVSIDNDFLAVQGEQISVDVIIPASLAALGYDAYIDFLLPDGTAYFKGAYDSSSGTVSFTLGAVDSILDKDGELFWQLVLATTVGDVRTEMWKSIQGKTVVLSSINATSSAILPYVPQMVFPATYPAENITLDDVDSLITATDAEGAFREILLNISQTETFVGSGTYELLPTKLYKYIQMDDTLELTIPAGKKGTELIVRITGFHGKTLTFGTGFGSYGTVTLDPSVNSYEESVIVRFIARTTDWHEVSRYSTHNSKHSLISDAGSRITATNVEDALQEIVGTGRTTQTIKANADAIALRLAVDGWLPVTESWTYASASTITVPTGAASRYQKGDKVKWTQTTVKYGVIIAVADTLITLAPNAGYAVSNATISAISISRIANPFGFPAYFTFSPTFVGASPTYTLQDGRFSTHGNKMHITFRIVITATGSLSGNLGIGGMPVAALSTATAKFSHIYAITMSGIYVLGIFGEMGATQTYISVRAYSNGSWNDVPASGLGSTADIAGEVDVIF